MTGKPVSAFWSIMNCIYCIRMILEGKVTKIEVKGSGECILEEEEGVLMLPHQASVIQTFFHRWQNADDTISEETWLDPGSFGEMEQYYATRARLIYYFLQATSLFMNLRDRDLDFFIRTTDEELATVCELTDSEYTNLGRSCYDVAKELALLRN